MSAACAFVHARIRKSETEEREETSSRGSYTMEFSECNSESPVWGYFLRCKEKEKAKCYVTCNAVLCGWGGSASGLRAHLRIKHRSACRLQTLPSRPRVSQWRRCSRTSRVSYPPKSVLSRWFLSWQQWIDRASKPWQPVQGFKKPSSSKDTRYQSNVVVSEEWYFLTIRQKGRRWRRKLPIFERKERDSAFLWMSG